jgi:RsiW-degrading membrane proteinase PrsW (M82 family)
LRARDELAGRRAKCPGCGMLVLVIPSVMEALPVLEEENEPPPPAPPPVPPQPVAPLATLAYAGTTTPDQAEPLVHGAERPLPVIARAPEEIERLERGLRGNLFWLFLLAMIPLAWLAFFPHASVEERIRQTLQANPALAGKYSFSEHMPLDVFHEMIDALPGGRIQGALLRRQTVWHWLMALASTALFAGIIRLALPTSVRAKEILLTGLFTGTLGVLLLLAAQFFGACCCIGMFYTAALDPDAPFGPSLIGFVFGIGFMEETIKCLPILFKLYRRQLVSWRESAVIGMASGAGFGISEGVLYATRYYNGLEPADMYFVRFLSTVALHVMLSAACAIMIQRKQEHLVEEMDFINWTLTLMAIIIMPIALHGLYNALAKQNLQVASLAVSIGSFVWMWWLIKSSRGREKTVAVTISAMPQLVRTAKGTRFIAPPPQLPPRR